MQETEFAQWASDCRETSQATFGFISVLKNCEGDQKKSKN
jgi:hypothetical protein